MKEIFEKLKGTKLYVPSDMFIELQKVLFEIGFKWTISDNEIKTEDRPFIFLNHNGLITWHSSLQYYKEKNYKEIHPFNVIDLRNEFLINKFKGTKVFISNADISTKVQKRLLELGFHYQSGSTKVNNVDCPFLYIENDCNITFGLSLDAFKATNYKEIYVNEIIDIKR